MVSTSGGLTHSGPSILPRSAFVAPDNTKWLYYKRSTNREAHDVYLLRCTPHCSVHHPDVLPLPPVALQKGERDAQVQFRGCRHTSVTVTWIGKSRKS
ncbi:hypothetical protein T03_994 [Trichinella britovi]|uniref:Uncharacterized protein n=1 Tax=Trichinella britovi TaxID=45882 RepID=A0A0V1CRR4_TRIBR|nr:hypothetical protein T03_994 [Trichinella britovi]